MHDLTFLRSSSYIDVNGFLVLTIKLHASHMLQRLGTSNRTRTRKNGVETQRFIQLDYRGVLWQFFNLIVKQAANNYRVIFCFVKS